MLAIIIQHCFLCEKCYFLKCMIIFASFWSKLLVCWQIGKWLQKSSWKSCDFGKALTSLKDSWVNVPFFFFFYWGGLCYNMNLFSTTFMPVTFPFYIALNRKHWRQERKWEWCGFVGWWSSPDWWQWWWTCKFLCFLLLSFVNCATSLCDKERIPPPTTLTQN